MSIYKNCKGMIICKFLYMLALFVPLLLHSISFAVSLDGKTSHAIDNNKLFAQEPKYLPYLEIGGAKYFNQNSSVAGIYDLFIPIVQSEDQLFFSDLRIFDRSGSSFEGNAHLGFRKLFLDSKELFGVYAAFDRKKEESHHWFNQLTFGGEYWHNNWFFGGNLYRTIGKKEVLVDRAYSDKPEPSVSQSKEGLSISRTIQIYEEHERSLSGLDGEVGYSFSDNLTGYIGGYYFSADGAKTVAGPKLRATYSYSHPRGRFLGIFDGISLELGAQHDKPRGYSAYIGLKLKVGLTSPKSDINSNIFGFERHMTELVRRDQDIVTGRSKKIELANESGYITFDDGSTGSSSYFEYLKITKDSFTNWSTEELSKYKEWLLKEMGLTKYATTKDIKKAKREFIYKYHPDNCHERAGCNKRESEKIFAERYWVFEDLGKVNVALKNRFRDKQPDTFGQDDFFQAKRSNPDRSHISQLIQENPIFAPIRWVDAFSSQIFELIFPIKGVYAMGPGDSLLSSQGIGDRFYALSPLAGLVIDSSLSRDRPVSDSIYNRNNRVDALFHDDELYTSLRTKQLSSSLRAQRSNPEENERWLQEQYDLIGGAIAKEQDLVSPPSLGINLQVQNQGQDGNLNCSFTMFSGLSGYLPRGGTENIGDRVNIELCERSNKGCNINYQNVPLYTTSDFSLLSSKMGQRVESAVTHQKLSDVDQSKPTFPFAPLSDNYINPEYEYEARDIDTLLPLRAKEAQLDLKNIIILPAMEDKELGNQLLIENFRHLEKLKDDRGKIEVSHARDLLIPINSPDIHHWIGVIVRIDEFNNPFAAYYLDSLSDSSLRSQGEANQFFHNRGVKIQRAKELIQCDNTSCGPVAIENLILVTSRLRRKEDQDTTDDPSLMLNEEETKKIREVHIELAEQHAPSLRIKYRQKYNLRTYEYLTENGKEARIEIPIEYIFQKLETEKEFTKKLILRLANAQLFPRSQFGLVAISGGGEKGKIESEDSSDLEETMEEYPMFPVDSSYEYEDDIMNGLLKLRAEEAELNVTSGEIILMAPISNLEGNTLQEQLRGEMQRATNSEFNGVRKLLIPFNIGNLHWVALVVMLQGEEALQIKYSDSLDRGILQVPEWLSNELSGVYGEVIPEAVRGLMQTDTTSCGPLAIENLINIAKDNIESREIASEESKSIRQKHLHLATHYAPELKLQEKQNNPSNNLPPSGIQFNLASMPMYGGSGKKKKEDGPIEKKVESEDSLNTENDVLANDEGNVIQNENPGQFNVVTERKRDDDKDFVDSKGRYLSDYMNKLLELYSIDKRLDIDTGTIVLMPAISDLEGNNFKQELDEEIKRLVSNEVLLLIPFDVGDYHWIALIIIINEQKALKLQYVDSVENDISEKLDIIKKAYEFESFERIGGLKNDNPVNSGLLTIQNLINVAKGTIKEVKVSEDEIKKIKEEDEKLIKYSARDTAANLGFKYQILLSMEEVFSRFTNEEHFTLYMERDDVGKFDDFCLKTKDVFKMVQSKYTIDPKEELTAGMLGRKKDTDFSLAKYYNSFYEKKDGWAEISGNRETEFILCTNRKMGQSLSLLVDKDKKLSGLLRKSNDQKTEKIRRTIVRKLFINSRYFRRNPSVFLIEINRPEGIVFKLTNDAIKDAKTNKKNIFRFSEEEISKISTVFKEAIIEEKDSYGVSLKKKLFNDDKDFYKKFNRWLISLGKPDENNKINFKARGFFNIKEDDEYKDLKNELLDAFGDITPKGICFKLTNSYMEEFGKTKAVVRKNNDDCDCLENFINDNIDLIFDIFDEAYHSDKPYEFNDANRLPEGFFEKFNHCLMGMGVLKKDNKNKESILEVPGNFLSKEYDGKCKYLQSRLIEKFNQHDDESYFEKFLDKFKILSGMDNLKNLEEGLKGDVRKYFKLIDNDYYDEFYKYFSEEFIRDIPDGNGHFKYPISNIDIEGKFSEKKEYLLKQHLIGYSERYIKSCISEKQDVVEKEKLKEFSSEIFSDQKHIILIIGVGKTFTMAQWTVQEIKNNELKKDNYAFIPVKDLWEDDADIFEKKLDLFIVDDIKTESLINKKLTDLINVVKKGEAVAEKLILICNEDVNEELRAKLKDMGIGSYATIKCEPLTDDQVYRMLSTSNKEDNDYLRFSKFHLKFGNFYGMLGDFLAKNNGQDENGLGKVLRNPKYLLDIGKLGYIVPPNEFSNIDYSNPNREIYIKPNGQVFNSVDFVKFKNNLPVISIVYTARTGFKIEEAFPDDKKFEVTLLEDFMKLKRENIAKFEVSGKVRVLDCDGYQSLTENQQEKILAAKKVVVVTSVGNVVKNLLPHIKDAIWAPDTNDNSRIIKTNIPYDQWITEDLDWEKYILQHQNKDDFTAKHIIVALQAGMGKSTTVQKLGAIGELRKAKLGELRKIKEGDYFWVVPIYLDQITMEDNKLELVDFVLKTLSKEEYKRVENLPISNDEESDQNDEWLTSDWLKAAVSYDLAHRNVLLLLDGGDQVSSSQFEAGKEIYKKLLNYSDVIFLTRPEQSLLSFDANVNLVFKQFDEKPINGYFKEAFPDKDSTDTKNEPTNNFYKKAEEFLSNNDFKDLLGIPLQCHLLWQAWHPYYVDYLNSSDDKSVEVPSLQSKLSSLYEQFIKSKLFIHFQRNLNIGQGFLEENLDKKDRFERASLLGKGYMDRLARVAVAKHFSDDIKYLEPPLQDIEKADWLDKDLEKTSLIKRITGAPETPVSYNFYHRTYQEYLAAKFFVESLFKINISDPNQHKWSRALLNIARFNHGYQKFWQFVFELVENLPDNFNGKMPISFFKDAFTMSKDWVGKLEDKYWLFWNKKPLSSDPPHNPRMISELENDGSIYKNKDLKEKEGSKNSDEDCYEAKKTIDDFKIKDNDPSPNIYSDICLAISSLERCLFSSEEICSLIQKLIKKTSKEHKYVHQAIVNLLVKVSSDNIYDDNFDMLVEYLNPKNKYDDGSKKRAFNGLENITVMKSNVNRILKSIQYILEMMYAKDYVNKDLPVDKENMLLYVKNKATDIIRMFSKNQKSFVNSLLSKFSEYVFKGEDIAKYFKNEQPDEKKLVEQIKNIDVNAIELFVTVFGLIGCDTFVPMKAWLGISNISLSTEREKKYDDYPTLLNKLSEKKSFYESGKFSRKNDILGGIPAVCAMRESFNVVMAAYLIKKINFAIKIKDDGNTYGGWRYSKVLAENIPVLLKYSPDKNKEYPLLSLMVYRIFLEKEAYCLKDKDIVESFERSIISGMQYAWKYYDKYQYPDAIKIIWLCGKFLQWPLVKYNDNKLVMIYPLSGHLEWFNATDSSTIDEAIKSLKKEV